MKKPFPKVISCSIALLVLLSSAIGCSRRAQGEYPAATMSEASPAEASPSEASPSEPKTRETSDPKKLVQLSEIPDFSGRSNFMVNEGCIFRRVSTTCTEF